LTGLSDKEGFSLCDAAVGRDEVVFLDADPSAGPWGGLGRIPREGMTFSVEELPETPAVYNPEFGPHEPSFTTPGGVDVSAVVIVKWPGGEARFAFPDRDGAQEAADNLKRQLDVPA